MVPDLTLLLMAMKKLHLVGNLAVLSLKHLDHLALLLHLAQSHLVLLGARLQELLPVARQKSLPLLPPHHVLGNPLGWMF